MRRYLDDSWASVDILEELVKKPSGQFISIRINRGEICHVNPPSTCRPPECRTRSSIPTVMLARCLSVGSNTDLSENLCSRVTDR